jgi:hypothetical protein
MKVKVKPKNLYGKRLADKTFLITDWQKKWFTEERK